ncbi:hypothetical protein C8T65DRAFT_694412 [Cerioporus squamosus]|nr:hypothetical protein C8T65DRAFT_694412 [Cerioporus squamosus]
MANSDLSSLPDSPATPPLPSSSHGTEYGSINTDLGVRKPPTRTGWTDILALPVLGAAYLVHWRYRRYAPRRVPTLTSLRLAELYGTAGFAWTMIREDARLKRRIMADRDLVTIEASAFA